MHYLLKLYSVCGAFSVLSCDALFGFLLGPLVDIVPKKRNNLFLDQCYSFFFAANPAVVNHFYLQF